MSITFSLSADSQFPMLPFPPLSERFDADYDARGRAVYKANCVVDDQRAEVEGEFNVSNNNGRYIVAELLGEEFDYCGEIDSNVAALRLATSVAVGAESKGVEAPSDDHGVRLTAEGVSQGVRMIDCGRSAGQIAGYVNALAHLIGIAQDRDCGICWG
jgi:hypothetical protein